MQTREAMSQHIQRETNTHVSGLMALIQKRATEIAIARAQGGQPMPAVYEISMEELGLRKPGSATVGPTSEPTPSLPDRDGRPRRHQDKFQRPPRCRKCGQRHA